MAIQDDFAIDVVNYKITYTTQFVDDRPPNIYTMNELYDWLQDTFDEPGFMQYEVPMSAQTPTQYTIINGWFIDDHTIKALYGGSLQTSGWTYASSEGITQLRWTDGSSDPPYAADLGVTLTGGTSTAEGTLLYVDGYRQVAYVRNTSANQFQSNENVTGTGVDIQTETTSGYQNGETVWSNLFSVGSLQTNTDIYVGQEDDYMGGRAYHTATTYKRKIEKIDEWWDADVDFTGSTNLIGGLGHFDILVKTKEAGVTIDSGNLAVFARQFSKIYSHFEFVGGVGNYVVPFASTGADLNSQDGPYSANFDNRSGNDLEVGDILENDTGTPPVGRLRAVVTAVTDGDQATGSFEYYLIGENEEVTVYERTLNQLDNDDLLQVRGDTTALQVNGAPTQVTSGPADDQGVTITFGNYQYDVDEDSTDEQYACVIDCNNVALASVYKYTMFLTCRGNQDGTTPDVQDTLLPSAADGYDETSEFYRAVGDVVFNWDGKTGTAPAEGAFVTNANSSWTASGVIVSLSGSAGASGVCVLTQVKGTWSDGDTVAVPGQHGSNEVTVDEAATGAARSIVDNTGAPFGSFAGGRWFVARGVVLINVPGADANNWETVDLAGTRRAPPTVRTITFAGLIANDRAALFEVDTAGGTDITKNQNGVGAAGALAGASSIPLDNTIALDVPGTGWIRVVDTSLATDGTEYRYEYSDITATTVTLRPVSPGDDVCDAGGSATVLVDTGIATSFGTNGNPKVGMLVRNTTSGGWAIVLRKISNDSIETTPLSSGTWTTGNGYALNVVVADLVDADTVYFPFIDDTATGTSIVKTVKYVEDTSLIARCRFSDPDVGGTRILPFSLTNITLEDANLTVTAIRTDDQILA
jgi:hypothetical protein